MRGWEGFEGKRLRGAGGRKWRGKGGKIVFKFKTHFKKFKCGLWAFTVEFFITLLL